uniref:Uncharacterized protein n=1 Tax=Ascaris lumbricoides TaxID=6252 RepID=A0A0M3IQD0_ASCLU
MLHNLASNNGCGDAANFADSKKKNIRKEEVENEFDDRIPEISSEEFHEKFQSSFMTGDHQKIPQVGTQRQSCDEKATPLKTIITSTDCQRTPEQRGKPAPPPRQPYFEWSPKLRRIKRSIVDQTTSFRKINFDIF